MADQEEINEYVHDVCDTLCRLAKRGNEHLFKDREDKVDGVLHRLSRLEDSLERLDKRYADHEKQYREGELGLDMNLQSMYGCISELHKQLNSELAVKWKEVEKYIEERTEKRV